MPRNRKKLCMTHSNDDEQRKPSRRRPKPNPAQEQKFKKEVLKASQLLRGVQNDDKKYNISDELDQQNDESEDGDDGYLDNYLPFPHEQAVEDEDVNKADTDDEIERFVKAHRGYRYAEKRERHRKQWEALESRMTAAYLYSQARTLNWTTEFCYLGTLSENCICHDSMFYIRRLDLIHMTGRLASKEVRFCKCFPEAVQLIYQGYLPSTPQKPCTAFSIPLLQLYYHLWKTAVCAASSFVEGLMDFHDTRTSDQLKVQGRGSGRRNLAQPFLSSTHLFNRIELLTKQILHKGLQFTKRDVWAERCSRCFGPAEDEHKQSPKEPDIIICMDGNFQHRHNILASKDTPEDSQYPSMFIRPSEIAPHKATTASLPSGPKQADDPCSEAHKTADDSRNSSTWDRCDDTGLFATACRHDVPLIMANIYKSGEKMYYPLSLLNAILNEFPTERFGILYDIGCHLDKHIKLHSLLPEHQERIMLGTSVFHAYVHTWACQLAYNPRFLEAWGLSDGEGLERLWSFLSPLIARLRTSTRLHRLLAIHLRCFYLAAQHRFATGSWLSRRFHNTRKTIQEAQSAVDQLCRQKNPFEDDANYTVQFFHDQWKSEKEANTRTSKDIKTQQKLELGKLLCLQQKIHTTWQKITLDRAFDRLDQVHDIANQIVEQRKKVGLSDSFTTLSPQGRDLLLQVWFLKTEVRSRFLALRAEQRPLDPEMKIGGGSKLGTHEQERVMQAIQRRTRTMKKTLGNYNQAAQSFRDQHPEHQTSPVIEYNDLVQLEADDPFWNNGIFTHSREPWAIDRGTQIGMRAIARLQRGQEELRRVGWEVRRAMRWATHEFKRVWDILVSLRDTTDNPPVSIDVFIQDEALSSLLVSGRVTLVKGLLHNQLVNISNLCIEWDQKVMEVLTKTPTQAADYELMLVWKQYILRIRLLRSKGFGSTKAGDFEHLFGTVDVDQIDLQPHHQEVDNDPLEPENSDEAHEEGDDDVWDQRINEHMMQQMVVAVGQEREDEWDL